jgi:hypothetical protein
MGGGPFAAFGPASGKRQPWTMRVSTDATAAARGAATSLRTVPVKVRRSLVENAMRGLRKCDVPRLTTLCAGGHKTPHPAGSCGELSPCVREVVASAA